MIEFKDYVDEKFQMNRNQKKPSSKHIAGIFDSKLKKIEKTLTKLKKYSKSKQFEVDYDEDLVNAFIDNLDEINDKLYSSNKYSSKSKHKGKTYYTPDKNEPSY